MDNQAISNTISNFMDGCKGKCGFTLPAVYSRFVTKSVGANHIDAVIYHNNVDMTGAFTIVKYFIRLLFQMKNCIEKILGEEYSVEVFNSLGYMEEWSFNKHTFKLCEHGELKKLPHIERSVTIRVSSRYCDSPTIEIYPLSDRICKGLNKNHRDVLTLYQMFTGEDFP